MRQLGIDQRAAHNKLIDFPSDTDAHYEDAIDIGGKMMSQTTQIVDADLSRKRLASAPGRRRF